MPVVPPLRRIGPRPRPANTGMCPRELLTADSIVFSKSSRLGALLTIVFTSSVAFGCESNVRPLHTTIDTLANGVVRVSNPIPVESQRSADMVTEVFRIGDRDTAGPTAFGRINGLLLGSTGDLYVLDGYAREVRMFDSLGAHSATFGGGGAGPGEFQDPRGLIWGPDGNVWIMDRAAQRYTVLGSSGRLVTTFRRRIPAFGTYWRGAFDGQGLLYEPTVLPDPRRSGGRSVLIAHSLFPEGPMPVDTFPLPQDARADFYVSFPGGTLSLPVPYAPRPHWALDPRGMLWVGTGREFKIAKRTPQGDTLLVFLLDRDIQEVSASERARVRQRIDSQLTAIGASPEQLDFSRIPDSKPAHGRILIDGDERIWIAGPPDSAAGDGISVAPFDVFSPGGRHLALVHLEISPDRPMAFAGDRVAGVTADSAGTPTVVVYRVDIPTENSPLERQERMVR